MSEEPDELLRRLSDESLSANLSLAEWVEYLQSMKTEVDHWLRMAENDLAKKN